MRNHIRNFCQVNGVIIFNRNNPNFLIKNSNEDLEKMFTSKYPVPIFTKEDEKDIIIGFVKDVEFWSEELLIGDIFLWDDKYLGYTLYNYEVQVDDDMNITSVISIWYKNEKDDLSDRNNLSLEDKNGN